MKVLATKYTKSRREIEVEFPLYRRNDVCLDDNHDIAVFERTSFDEQYNEFVVVRVTLGGYYGDHITDAEIETETSSELEDRGDKYFTGTSGHGSDAEEFKAAVGKVAMLCGGLMK
jgi:hypothetical protein